MSNESDLTIRGLITKFFGDGPTVRRIGVVFGALVLAFVLLIVLIGIRLYYSPMSIGSYSRDVQAYVSSYLPEGQTFELDDIKIKLTETGKLALSLFAVKLEQGDEEVLNAPVVDLELSLVKLLQREVVPKSINIDGMEVKARRDTSGRILVAGQDPSSLGAAVAASEQVQTVRYDPDEPELTSLIYSLRHATQWLADENLDKRPPKIFIQNTTVYYTDELADLTKTYHSVKFLYSPVGKEDNLWRIDFAFNGRHGRVRFAMGEIPFDETEQQGEDQKAEIDEQMTKMHSVQLKLEDLTLEDLFIGFAKTADEFKFYSPLSGAAQLDFDQDGNLVNVVSDIRFGASLMDFDHGDIAYLDEARFLFQWDPRTRFLKLRRGHVFFGETGGEFAGNLQWPDNPNGDVLLSVEGRNIKLASRDYEMAEKTLNEVALNARINLASNMAVIDRFAMTADEGSLQGGGQVFMSDGDLGTKMSFDVSAMPYELLVQMWPVNIANGARKWLIENLTGGSVTGGKIGVNLMASMLERNDQGLMVLPENSVDISFGFKDLSVNGFGDLPASNLISGEGTVDGRKFLAFINKGQFVTKSGKSFPLKMGRFEIPDHSLRPSVGILSLDGEGEASIFGEIVDSDPLNMLQKQKVKASDLSGKANAKVQIELPLLKDLKKEEVDYSAHITLTDFSSKSPLQGRMLSNANLVVNTDGKRVDIKGKAKVDDLTIALAIDTSFDGSIAEKANFQLILTGADRKNLGFDVSDWLRGPVTVKAVQDESKKGQTEVEIDLTKAEVKLSEIGWSKKPNVRGKANLRVIEHGDGYELQSIQMTGDGFDAEGSALIGKKGELQNLLVSKLNLSRGDRLRFELIREKSGLLRLDAVGEVLDLRGKLKGNFLVENSADSGSGENISVNARIEKVIGLSNHTINNLVAKVEVVDGVSRWIDVDGKLDGNSLVKITSLAGDGNKSARNVAQPVLNMDFQDAGGIFRFIGVTDRIVGGRLALSVTLLKGWENIKGVFFLKDFKLSGQVEKQQSAKSSTQTVDSSFDKFSMDFEGKSGVFTLSKGALKGPVLGATVDGVVNMRSKMLALTGTYIPAYKLNNIFSRLPVIGLALGNRKNEGLLGITYSIKGNLANPTLIVNPASLLAPGVFRKIFEY